MYTQSMTLPKSWTTVTPLSKTIALILFIFLPIIGFSAGMRYQQRLDSIEVNNKGASVSTSIPQPTPTPADIYRDPKNTTQWKIYTDSANIFRIKYPNQWTFSTRLGIPPSVGFGPNDDRDNSGNLMANVELSVEDISDEIKTDFTLDSYIKGSLSPTKIKNVDIYRDGLVSLEAKEIHNTSCPTTIDCISIIFRQGHFVFELRPNIDYGKENSKNLPLLYDMLSTFEYLKGDEYVFSQFSCPQAGPQDVMQCSDGRWVGRSGIYCELKC